MINSKLKNQVVKILANVMICKYGTKNRSELISSLEQLYLDIDGKKPRNIKYIEN